MEVVLERDKPHVEARNSGTETCLHPASLPGMAPDQALKASVQVMLGWKGHGLSILKFLWSDSVTAGPSSEGVWQVMLGWKGSRTFRYHQLERREKSLSTVDLNYKAKLATSGDFRRPREKM